ERLVASDELAEGLLEQRAIEGAREPHGRRGDEERVVRGELLPLPERLLTEREREVHVPCPPDEGWKRRHRPRVALAVEHRLDPLGQPRDGGLLEDGPYGKLDPERVPYSRDRLHGEERMAAELEEVRVATDALDAEHVRPHRRERLLE